MTMPAPTPPPAPVKRGVTRAQRYATCKTSSCSVSLATLLQRAKVEARTTRALSPPLPPVIATHRFSTCRTWLAEQICWSTRNSWMLVRWSPDICTTSPPSASLTIAPLQLRIKLGHGPKRKAWMESVRIGKTLHI